MLTVSQSNFKLAKLYYNFEYFCLADPEHTWWQSLDQDHVHHQSRKKKSPNLFTLMLMQKEWEASLKKSFNILLQKKMSSSIADQCAIPSQLHLKMTWRTSSMIIQYSIHQEQEEILCISLDPLSSKSSSKSYHL